MASARAHGRFNDGRNTRAHHDDQPKWRLGIAAYWLDTPCIGPDSKDQSPPMWSRGSTKPMPIRRGGISGKNVKPISASPVVKASVLRHSGYRSGWRRKSHTSATIVTMKWADP